MKKTNVVGKINWDIINAMQESAKVTSDDTWETILRVDPLYISDKDLVKQITQKVKLLSYYQMYRNRLDTPIEYNNWVNDMAWCVFREDSIENNREEINKMSVEYRRGDEE
jgi:hypoxanthine phosphoribosyltransferase|tara:strand:- start:6494 stop:6826 length:333 start_codon:yes stop_codon:yes gene_type:complete